MMGAALTYEVRRGINPARLITAILAMAVLLFIYALPVSALDEGVFVATATGDQVRLFENIDVEEDIKGNIIAVLGDIEVNSNVDGLVIAVFGDVKVNAAVADQVVTVFGNTVLTGNADIKGNLITLGSIEKDPGARVSGNEVRIFGEVMNVDVSAIFYLRMVSLVAFSLVVLIWGVLMLILSKKKYINDTAEIEKSGRRKLLLGILTFLGTAILLVLLSVTLVAPVLYFVLMIVANVFACLYFGKLIMKAMSAPRNIMVEFMTGFITITLIKLLVVFLVPQKEIILSLIIGTVVASYVSTMGLGVIMEARFAKK